MAVGGRRRENPPWLGTLGCLVVLIKTALCGYCLLFIKPTLSRLLRTGRISEVTELISKQSPRLNGGSRGQTTKVPEGRGEPTFVRFSGSFQALST